MDNIGSLVAESKTETGIPVLLETNTDGTECNNGTQLSNKYILTLNTHNPENFEKENETQIAAFTDNGEKGASIDNIELSQKLVFSSTLINEVDVDNKDVPNGLYETHLDVIATGDEVVEVGSDNKNNAPISVQYDELANQQSDNRGHANDVTSDIGDEFEESDECSNESQPFISNIYKCSACGWTPEMEKCTVHRSFQTGFANSMYQYQGIMPSQIHSYSNFNYGGYTAGQRPSYPGNSSFVQTAVNVQYNTNTNRVTATPVVAQTQTTDVFVRTIQSLRRKTFCLSIVVIFLVFGVVTLAILIS